MYVELGLKDTLESVGRYERGRYSECESGAAIPRVLGGVFRLRWDKCHGLAAMVIQTVAPDNALVTATTVGDSPVIAVDDVRVVDVHMV